MARARLLASRALLRGSRGAAGRPPGGGLRVRVCCARWRTLLRGPPLVKPAALTLSSRGRWDCHLRVLDVTAGERVQVRVPAQTRLPWLRSWVSGFRGTEGLVPLSPRCVDRDRDRKGRRRRRRPRPPSGTAGSWGPEPQAHRGRAAPLASGEQGSWGMVFFST